MSIIGIYNFLFNYSIESSFAAFMRIVSISYLIFCFYWGRKDIFNFSDPNGIFSFENYKNFNISNPQLCLFSFFKNQYIARKTIFISFFLSGIFSIFGLFTNLSLFIFLICMIGIQNRIYPMIFSGADSISRILITCIMITDCGSQYSLDNLLGISSNQETINGVGMRTLQICLCMIYFWSAIYKLRDPFWINGDTLKNAISSEIWGKRLFLNFFNRAIVSKILTWSILIFEYCAPFLFFIKETRNFAIVFAIFMHLGISIFMRIGYFGPIMIISVLSFCNDLFQ